MPPLLLLIILGYIDLFGISPKPGESSSICKDSAKRIIVCRLFHGSVLIDHYAVVTQVVFSIIM